MTGLCVGSAMGSVLMVHRARGPAAEMRGNHAVRQAARRPPFEVGGKRKKRAANQPARLLSGTGQGRSAKAIFVRREIDFPVRARSRRPVTESVLPLQPSGKPGDEARIGRGSDCSAAVRGHSWSSANDPVSTRTAHAPGFRCTCGSVDNLTVHAVMHWRRRGSERLQVRNGSCVCLGNLRECRTSNLQASF